MPTIDFTDDEYAAVTAAIRRAIEDDLVSSRPATRSAARGAGKVRRGAEARPRPTTAEDTAANSRRQADAALGLAAFLSPSLAAMITPAPHRLARMQGGDS